MVRGGDLRPKGPVGWDDWNYRPSPNGRPWITIGDPLTPLTPHWRSVSPANGQGPLHWPCVSFPSSRSGRSPDVTGPHRVVRIPFPSKVLPWNCPALAGTSALWPLSLPLTLSTYNMSHTGFRVMGQMMRSLVFIQELAVLPSPFQFSRYLNYGRSNDTSIIRMVRHKGQEWDRETWGH